MASSSAAPKSPTPGPASPTPGPSSPGPAVAAADTVEVDIHFDDDSSESGIESGESSATTSVASSVFDFQYANGRRYASDRFKKAEYYFPNDEQEQDRLDMYHHIFLMTLEGDLFTAPIEEPHEVLDVGTGTGIWAIDFADQFPSARVTGNDISPIQPSWVPQNCKFEVDDVEEDWTYRDNSLDYVHMRTLSGAIKDWPQLLANAFKAMKPGGYIEFQDYGCEGFLPDGTPLDDVKPPQPVGVWFSSVAKAADKLGRPLRVAKDMKQHLHDAGFVDIVEKKMVWPLSGWPKDPKLKDIGRWVLQGCIATVHPFAIMLLQREGWTDREINDMCDQAVYDLTKGRKKYYGEAWFVVGRKPEDC